MELSQNVYPWAQITIKYQVGTLTLKTNNELMNMYSHIIIILEHFILPL